MGATTGDAAAVVASEETWAGGGAKLASRWPTRVAPSPVGNSFRYSSYSFRACSLSPARSRATPISSWASCENLFGGSSSSWFSELIATSLLPLASAALARSSSVRACLSTSVSGASPAGGAAVIGATASGTTVGTGGITIGGGLGAAGAGGGAAAAPSATLASVSSLRSIASNTVASGKSRSADCRTLSASAFVSK